MSRLHRTRPTPRTPWAWTTLLILPIALLTSTGCIESRQVVAGPDALLPSVREAPAAEAAKPFSGLDLESTVSGSLIDLAFEPGLSVIAVAPGSPGEMAGIRAGDRVVEANGAVLESVAQLDALLAASGGEPVALEVERGHDVVDVELRPLMREPGRSFEPSRFAERLKGRFAATTVALGDAGRTAAEIVELLDRSPLVEAGVTPGMRVLALDGAPVPSGRALAQEIAARDFGSEVIFTIEANGARRDIEVELYDPPRRLTGLAVPLLFTWTRDLERDETSFELIDFWLFSIYERARQGAAIRHRLLWATVFESGVGEIATPEEETP